MGQSGTVMGQWGTVMGQWGTVMGQWGTVMSIFTVLILPMPKHGRSFHIMKSSSISFFRDLNFLSCRSFTCLVRVTPRYYILFVTVVMGVVSVISFSVHLFLEYRKSTNLFELILHPACLLKLFTSRRSICLQSTF